MTSDYYVTYRTTKEGGMCPEWITTDPALARQLLLEGRIEGYLVAQKMVTRLKSGTLTSLFGLHFGSLPWAEFGNNGIKAQRSLERYFRSSVHSYTPEHMSELNYPSVGDVFDFFWAHVIAGSSRVDGKMFPLRNFGKVLYETTCEVFNRVNLRLPRGELSDRTSLKADLESLVREWPEQLAAAVEEQREPAPTHFTRPIMTEILMAYDRLVLSAENEKKLVEMLSEQTGFPEQLVHNFLAHYFETSLWAFTPQPHKQVLRSLRGM